MISVYTWPSANCLKVHIALEEMALPYETSTIDILGGAHCSSEFLALDSNRRLPILVDSEGPDGAPISLADSSAILIYLAEKTGKLMPPDPAGQSAVMQWLAFQAGGLATFCGEALHYRSAVPDSHPYPIERYTKEAGRHFKVLETRLAGSDKFFAAEYSIADIAIFPWVHLSDALGQKRSDYPRLKRWYDEMAARPAIRTALQSLDALDVPRDGRRHGTTMFVAALDR